MMFFKGLMFFISLAVFTPMAQPAYALDADIYGYTKADDVSGSVHASGDPQTLELTGFSSGYHHPMEIYVSRGYDPAGGEMVGVLPPGFEGTATLTMPNRDVTEEDMVLIMIPGWGVPVAVGLFRNGAPVSPKAP
jgi:hypothetical protein